MRLRTRLAIVFFSAGALAMSLLVRENESAARRLLQDRAVTRAEALAEWLAGAVAPAIGEGRTLDASAVPVAGLPGVAWVRVEEPGGRTLYSWADPAASGPSVAASAPVPSDAPGWVAEAAVTTSRIELALAALRRRGAAGAAAGLAGLAAVSWLLGLILGRKLEGAVDELEGLAGRPSDEESGGSEVSRLLRAVSILRDTLRAEATRRAELERHRDELADMLVHDLRHPLTVMRMSVAVLREHDGSPDERSRAAYGMADGAIGRLDTMISTLLQIARLRSGEDGIRRERLLIGGFLRACAADNRLLAEQAGRRWSLEVDPSVEQRLVHGDAALLSRLLGNLVLNAVDHAPRSSHVVLGARPCRRDRTKVEFFVQDDGPGLSAAAAEAVGGKYATLAESARHAGLGLAFCRMAADRHGARLEFESTPGHGTVFRFALPAAFPREQAGGGAPKEERRTHA